MRIFVVMASGARGGGANHLLALLPALARIGVHSTVWVGDDGPLAQRLWDLGIEAVAQPLMGLRADVPLGRKCMVAAQISGASLVHAHGTRAAVLASLGAATLRRPLPRLYTAPGLAHRAGSSMMGRGTRLAFEWLACRRAQGLISVSAADLDVLRNLPGQSRVPTFHVPNVVTCAPPQGRLSPADNEAQMRARRHFGLPMEGAIVGTVSRLVPQKDVAALADAVLLLPGVHLAVVGEGPDRPKLEVHPLMRRGRMRLFGARDDVPQFLPALDAFALSSRWEGEPIALLEAMAFALPWVATATVGARELQGTCHTGILVPHNSPQKMASALERLLQDKPLAQREGRQGQQAMEARTPAALARRMQCIYDAVLSGHAPHDLGGAYAH